MADIEKQYMGWYINCNIGTTTGTAKYMRLGKDLEELTVELGAEVLQKANILGENRVTITSYTPSFTVEPYIANAGDLIFTPLQNIIDKQLVMDNCKTDIIEAHIWDGSGTSVPAIKQEVMVEVTSYGSSNENHYSIPFNVHYCGTRTKGTFNTTTGTFTATP